MNILNYHIPIEVVTILAVIFFVLVVCLITFYVLAKRKPSEMLTELNLRTRSWAYIAIGVATLVTAPAIVGTILVAYISFIALREMFSISYFRAADRTALAMAYIAIPFQYYFAYHGMHYQFLSFIPLFMFIGLPVLLVLEGKTEGIAVSMSVIPTMLMLTIYMLSHLVLLFSLEVPGFEVGAGGLILFLIMCTAFNDVFQFTWGKLMGKKKIIPTISPNKTWAGFIGGFFTTGLLGFLLKFLTPLTGFQAVIIGLAIGISGFLGDLIISAIKRDLRIKDTGDLIPGHGGVMDRLDSMMLTTPVFYHLLQFFIEN